MPLQKAKAVKLIASPGYKAKFGATQMDFGIIHLDKSIGESIGYWHYDHKTTLIDSRGTSILKGRLPVNVGKLKVNLSGYPTDLPEIGGGKGTYQYSAYNRTVLLKKGMLHYLNDTFKGHSGSPVWVKRSKWKGGRVLAGIHVAGDDGIGTTANRAVFIDADVREFIRDNLK